MDHSAARKTSQSHGGRIKLCLFPSDDDGEEYYEWLFVAYYSVGNHEKANETIAHGLRVNPLSPAFRQRAVEYGCESPVSLSVEEFST